MEGKEFTREEVKKHNTEEDCWTIVHNDVYKLDGFVRKHPGGLKLIQKAMGADCSVDFEATFHSKRARTMLEGFKIGTLVASDRVATSGPNPAFGGRGGPPFNPMMQNRFLAVPIHRPSNSTSNSPFKSPILPQSTIKVVNTTPQVVKSPPSNLHTLILEHSSPVNHNTKLFSFTVRSNDAKKVLANMDESLTCYHIRFYLKHNDEVITRSYTPIDLNFIGFPALENNNNNNDNNNNNTCHLDFIIKSYPQGKMSSFIHSLSKNDSKLYAIAQTVETLSTVTSSNPQQGTLSHQTGYQYIPNKWKAIVLVSGGTGMSPMLQIAKFRSMSKETDATSVLWINVNSKREDILLESQLRDLQVKYSSWLSISFVLTTPHQSVKADGNEFNFKLTLTSFKDVFSRWYYSRFSQQQLNLAELQILSCGPVGFNQTMDTICQQISWPKENVIVFE